MRTVAAPVFPGATFQLALPLGVLAGVTPVFLQADLRTEAADYTGQFQT